MSFCQSCGTKVPDGSAFCPECGAPVNGVQSPAQNQNNAGTQKSQPEINVMPERIRSRQLQKEKVSQPNPIEEWVMSFADKISSFASLKTAMITVIICQVLQIIYFGEVFHFSGVLEDLTDFFTDNVPFWIWNTIYNLATIYMFVNIVDTCYKIGMKSWTLYIAPLLWIAALILFDIAVLTEMGYDDLKWIGRMVIVSYILVGVIGYQLSSSRFGWLGKVTIITAILWIVDGLADESLIISILSIAATIYWAIVAKNEISKFYDDMEQAYYDQNLG